MALIDVYNFNPLSFTSVSDELHSNLGSSDYQIGIAARGFKGGSDFVVKNVGYQEISNTGNLGSFTGSTVAGIATQSDWELDVTIDSTLYQLDDILINIADDWDDVCSAIQTSLQTATSGNETVAIVSGKIRVTSKDSYGSGSSVLIEAGTAGTGSGDLIAAITALSADYTATIDTAVDGATLVEDTDYELSVFDQKLTNATALYTTKFTVYTRVKILDADYQDTDLYLSYKIVNSDNDAVYFNYQNTRITQNETDIATNTAAIASIGVLPNFMDGLEISNNGSDADHDIDIAAGTISADDQSKYLVLSSGLTKQIDAAWAKGTNQGGLDTGSVASDTFYYFWVIEQDSSSDIDILISASASSPTMPAGWTAKGFTGDAVLTDGSANILPFRLNNNSIRYNALILDVDDSSPGTSRNLAAVSVPPGMEGVFNFGANLNSAGQYIIQEVSDTDVAPSSFNCDIRTSSDSSKANIVVKLFVDASSQIAYRSTTNSAVIRIKTYGFINPKR